MEIRMTHLLNSFLASKRLNTIDVSKPRKEINDDLTWVYTKLREIDVDMDILNEIDEFKRKMIQKYDETLDYNEREELKINLRIWSNSIEKHLKERRILEPSKTGMISHEKLYEVSIGYSSTFFEDVWWKMSEIEKNDFKEAAKCLLTQSWTAAAMISLRGLEGILRKYYEFKTEKEHRNRGMYDLIEELQKIEGIKQTLMSYLNYLRGIRNTAEHPDRVFNQIDAETVFIQVARAAQEIYQEMSG